MEEDINKKIAEERERERERERLRGFLDGCSVNKSKNGGKEIFIRLNLQ